MDERRVVDYFVIAGLPEETKPFDDFARDQHLKSTHSQAPITDITVIFPSLNEEIPKEYELIHRTPGGNLADLNHGSLRSPDVYLCYRRGFDKPPLVDIGVMFEGKESILPDSEVVETTHWNHCANINNSTSKTFLTFRRARPEMPCNSLVVTDIAVILANKESVPHAFCMINKNLNRGLVGSDVYICYKKSMNRTNHISYKPEILLRYPFEDRVNLPLPETVPMFCLPLGCSLERWPKTAQQSDPIFSTFVLTVSDAAEKLYGSAITFYESYPEEKLTEEQKKAIDSKPGLPVSEWTYNVNKCICILSRWPFFDTYERFLTFLYEMSISPNPHPVSIERFVLHFLEEIPFPSSHGPGIFVELSPKEKLILTQPEEVPLPRSGAKFQKLLMNLGPDNCLLILVCALTEQKILVHSLRPDVLTAVAEALSMILFPFKWQCPYIPLCPLGLAEVLHAPLPFLIGVDSRFFDLYDPPADVICIDLDTNNISLSDEKKKEKDLSIKLLPKKPGRVLRQTLETIYKHLEALMHQPLNNLDNTSIDKEFQLKRKEQKLELDIQVAFLQFMATILKGYKSYLLPITKAPTVGTTDTNSLFDLNGFLKSRNKDWHKFFNYLTKTQMFIRFIEERSFVSDMDAGLAFFDECADKVEEDENVHLLEMDDSHRSERTVIIMPPEPTGQLYTYQGFNLNPKLLDPNANNLGSKDKNTSRTSGTGIAPGSPMARRTKHEIKAAQRLARKCAMSPQLWARCLWSTCCSIWFIHLPSYVLSAQSAPTILQYAYDVMVKVHKCNLVPSDEICFRVMMQLCGAYHQPVVAVKLLFHMKRAGVQPNAITYGFYNRAVLEATWPSGMSNSGQLLWNKLRNVVLGAALFKKAGVSAEKRRLSTITDDGLSLLDPPPNCGSHTSIDSAGSFNQKNVAAESIEQPEENDNESSDGSVANSEGFAAFDKFRSRVGSIVRPSGLPLLNQSSTFKQPTFESSAGLLITGLGGPLKEEELDLSQLNVVTSPNGLVSSKRRYHRSGSCTEFNNPLRQPPPTSPPNPTINENSYKILTRSESFANDAGILAKLHTLKLDSLTLGSSRDSLKENPKVQQKTWSKSLFRRGSLNMRKFNVAPESCESSTENLGSTGSGAGSYEDIYNNMGTPKRGKFGKTKNKYRPERHSSTSNIVAEVDENTNRSPVKSPSRTPVTENDPLGALILGSEQEEEEEEKKKVSRVPSEIELDDTGAPLLFERRGGDFNSVVRSATFTNEESDEEYEPGRPKSMHRSSTMPNSIDAPPPSFGSFKLPFARYSPSRFSLRKAADRINTQMIVENITSLSPNLTSKKSNELIMGGLSSLKSAATSVAKKIDELKGAISANTTPVKSASHRSTLERDACLMEDEEYGEEYSVRRKISMEYSPVNRASGNDNWGSNWAEWFMDGSRKGSSTNLGTDTTFDGNFFASQQCILFPKFQRDPNIPIALQIIMTTCSKCHNCSSVLYDEEIMAGWIPEDSNLNTKCQFCDKATVPLLSVSVIDYRNSPMVVKERKISTVSLEASRTSLISDSGFVNGEDEVQPKTCEPITVPYLNPLVLRKEFESILTAEGDSALTQPKFVDEHPIIYWNMVWMFTRINMDSHFPGLALGSNSTLSDPHPSWENAGSANVLISTVWHNSRLNDEVGPPMYLSWNMNSEHSPLVSALITDQARVSTKEFQNVLQKTLSCLQCSDLVEPLKFLAVERKKLKGRGHSLYREILFLGITALGRENIDQGAFDKEYQNAYEKIMERNPDLYIKCDQPISAAATFCRQYFRPLEL